MQLPTIRSLRGEACAALRTHDDQKKVVLSLREQVSGLSKTAVEELLRQASFNKLYYPLDDAYLPNVDYL